MAICEPGIRKVQLRRHPEASFFDSLGTVLALTRNHSPDSSVADRDSVGLSLPGSKPIKPLQHAPNLASCGDYSPGAGTRCS